MKIVQCPRVASARQELLAATSTWDKDHSSANQVRLQAVEEALQTALRYPITTSPVPRSHTALEKLPAKG
jgi:hypothetical protein